MACGLDGVVFFDRESIEQRGLSFLKVEDVLRDMHVVCGAKVSKGFDAYRALAGRIPFFWFAWPFLFLRPVSWSGERICQRIANLRVCSISNEVEPVDH